MLASPLLASALVLSLLLHAGVFIAVEFGRVAGWWDPEHSLFGRTVASAPKPRETIEVTIDLAQPKPPEEALAFVEVTPSQATSESPATTKFYSDRNSRAANPDTTLDSDTPKITGTQDKVPKTVDTPRALATPSPPRDAAETSKTESLQPPTPSPVKPVETPELSIQQPEKTSGPLEKGDLLLADTTQKSIPNKSLNPSDSRTPSTGEGSPARRRPRRLAMVQPQDQSVLAGEKMKQSGGVRRYGVEPSFDVKFTEFGAYDKAVIEAIQNRWYRLLEDRDLPRNIGKVVLEFHLTSKGRITHMRETENGVGSLLGILCQRAVQEPAPYGEWPLELRRLVGRDYREVRFVFYYN